MSQIASAASAPVTFSFTDPSTGSTTAADTSRADFARLSLSARMAAIVADGVDGRLLVGEPSDQALFTLAGGGVTELAVPAGFEAEPADMAAATFASFSDDVKSAYLTFHQLPANASIGTGQAAFPASLASATAKPFIFPFRGALDTSLSDFETLDTAARAVLVRGYGTNGELLVGTPDAGEALFTLGADDATPVETAVPAGFALVPAAMDATTFASFTPDQASAYLALNGLGADARLGTGASAFPAYPTASFSVPPAFPDARNVPSTSLIAFDALSPALQKVVVQQAGTAGMLLVGTPGYQAVFTLNASGGLTRTAVPSGFALIPSAMDATTFGAFPADVQALYLASNGLVPGDTLGSGSSAFAATVSAAPAGPLPPGFDTAPAAMVPATWTALTMQQQTTYLQSSGLSHLLLVPAAYMTAATFATLSPAEQAFLAVANGLPASIDTAPAAMTAATWTGLSTAQQSLYLALHGLSNSLAATAAALTADAYAALTPDEGAFLAAANGLPREIDTATSAMTAATWAGLTTDQQARYLALHGLSGSLATPASAMTAAAYAALKPVETAFFAAANGLPAEIDTATSAMTAAIWTGLEPSEASIYLAVHGLSASLFDGTGMTAAAYGLLSPNELSFFVASTGLPATFTTAPGAMTAAIGATLTDGQRGDYLALNGAAGASLAPSAMDAATFGAFTDAQKALYLAVFGLTPGASLGQDAASDFTAHLSSDYARPIAFVNAGGAISQSATEFDALSNDVQAAEVQALGNDGVLLVGNGIFVLGGNGAVNQAPAPAGFGLLPSAMDGTTFGGFSASEKSLYLRLNGLPIDATLGTGASAFRAYPAASLSVPKSFVNLQNTQSTSLVDFDALPPAVQKQVVQAEGTGGVLLVGTPGYQAVFSIDASGALVRTPVTSGFALVPSAMDAATYGSFTAAAQALYLAGHALASTATLGSGSAAFNASTTGMTATDWAALSAAQKGNYLAQHGLSDSLSLPAQSTTGATLGMATYAALSPAERTFFAQVNGLPAAINTSPEAMTQTAWNTLSGSGRQALYLSLHGLSSNLTRTGVSLQPSDASNTTQMTPLLYQHLSQIERSFYAKVNGFPPEFATAPEQMTAATWAAIGDDLNTTTVYLPLNGLSTAVTFKQNILPGTYAGLTIAEKSFAATIGNQPASFIVAPSAMTAAIWNTFSVATKTSYLSENNLKDKLKDPVASFNVQFSSLTATEQAFLIAVNSLPATFATTPTAMTAAIWRSFAPAQQNDYLRINDTISTHIMEIDGAISGPITSDTRSLYNGLQSASKTFFAAIEGLPSGFATMPSAMTATIWATLAAPQKDLYLQLNGLSNSLTTKAANTTTAAYQALTAGERTFFAAVNGLPTTFVNAPTAMTSAIWTGYTTDQKIWYLGLNGLSPDAAASAMTISPADYGALTPAERQLFAIINQLPVDFSIAPDQINTDQFSGLLTKEAQYLALNGLPVATTIGNPPFIAYPESYFNATSFSNIAHLKQLGGAIDPDSLISNNLIQISTFEALHDSSSNYDDATNTFAYGQPDYINNYGTVTNIYSPNVKSLLVGIPGDQALFTTNQTPIPVAAAFGVAKTSMTSALFATLPQVQQTAYISYYGVTAAEAAQFGVTLASDGSFTVQSPTTTFPTAAVTLPAAPYAPPTATATALFSHTTVSAEIQATSGITYQAVPYGPAITGADLLGSTINQAVADKLFAVQDGTDTATLAVIRGLTGQNAADYATVPASLAPSTFENWSSQEQLAYLRKNVSTSSNGVFTIGTGDSSIHVFVGTPTSSSVPPKIYIAETLSKTTIAAMAYADQVKLASIPGISSTLNALGLTTNVDAVKQLLLKAYQCVAASGDSHTTSSGKVFTGASSINNDDKNIFIGEMNLLAAQLLGLTAPTAPGGASGTGTDTATALSAQSTLSGVQTGGSAVFSLDAITAQLNAIQDRFVRFAAFASTAKNKATVDASPIADDSLEGPKYSMADKDVSVVNGYNTFAQQEAVIAQSAFAMAHLTASGKSSSGQDLDLPTLICLFELFANASQQAVVKADTQEINQVNVLLQEYSLAQKSVNLSIAGTKANTDSSKASFAPADDPGSRLQTMFSGNAIPSSPSSPIETLYGVTRIYISTDGRTNEYFQQIANNLSAAVTTINQQSQIKMNDVTSENKQADRYFDLANTALSKMSDVLQKIAGAN